MVWADPQAEAWGYSSGNSCKFNIVELFLSRFFLKKLANFMILCNVVGVEICFCILEQVSGR
jgi:hypothetical protein